MTYLLLGACVAVAAGLSVRALFYFLFGGTILLPILTAAWLDVRMAPRIVWLSEDTRRREAMRSGGRAFRVLGRAFWGPLLRLFSPVLLFPLSSILLAALIHRHTGMEAEDRVELGRALGFFVLLLLTIGLFSWCGVLGSLARAIRDGAGKRGRHIPLFRWTAIGISLAYGTALTCCTVHFATTRALGRSSGTFSRNLTLGLVALIGVGIVLVFLQWRGLRRACLAGSEYRDPRSDSVKDWG